MPSFSTTYVCPACAFSAPVEITDLGDPYAHIPEDSRSALRRVRETENRLGHDKPGDPVDELANELLAQAGRSELRYATCPKCGAKNPEGLAADRADRRQTLLLGGGVFVILAVIAWFYPKAALFLPGMDLFVFRPIMFVQARKNTDKPFPTGLFIVGILFDLGLVAVILYLPQVAFLIPVVGILQSLRSGSSKYEWRWDEGAKKIRFQEA